MDNTNQNNLDNNQEKKSFMTTAMLSLFLGAWGIDRFYLGKIGTGILKLITFGGFGIWYLIDLIIILTGSAKSKNGQPLKGREKNLKLALIITVIWFALSFIISTATIASSPKTTTVTVQTNNTTQPATTKPAVVAEPKQPEVPTEYKSALSQATSYSNTLHMSKQGVYNQLVSEYGGKFSAAAAQYGIDNVKADWNANALAKAKTYQDTMHQSPAAIHDQLTSEYGERFTQSEADYAIQHL